jgi:hypothetical protein
VVGVEQWAETRRMHFVVGLSIKEIARLRDGTRGARKRQSGRERVPYKVGAPCRGPWSSS